jgi:hypothetical protein
VLIYGKFSRMQEDFCEFSSDVSGSGSGSPQRLDRAHKVISPAAQMKAPCRAIISVAGLHTLSFLAPSFLMRGSRFAVNSWPANSPLRGTSRENIRKERAAQTNPKFTVDTGLRSASRPRIHALADPAKLRHNNYLSYSRRVVQVATPSRKN